MRVGGCRCSFRALVVSRAHSGWGHSVRRPSFFHASTSLSLSALRPRAPPASLLRGAGLKPEATAQAPSKESGRRERPPGGLRVLHGGKKCSPASGSRTDRSWSCRSGPGLSQAWPNFPSAQGSSTHLPSTQDALKGGWFVSVRRVPFFSAAQARLHRGYGTSATRSSSSTRALERGRLPSRSPFCKACSPRSLRRPRV